MFEISAKFFWLKSAIEEYSKYIGTSSTKGLPWNDGYLIYSLPANKNITEEQLIKFSTQYFRDYSKVNKLLQKPSKQSRYLVVFKESPYIHVFYKEHWGDILKAGHTISEQDAPLPF